MCSTPNYIVNSWPVTNARPSTNIFGQRLSPLSLRASTFEFPTLTLTLTPTLTLTLTPRTAFSIQPKRVFWRWTFLKGTLSFVPKPNPNPNPNPNMDNVYMDDLYCNCKAGSTVVQYGQQNGQRTQTHEVESFKHGVMFVQPFGTAVQLWGQTTSNLCGLSPKGD